MVCLQTPNTAGMGQAIRSQKLLWHSEGSLWLWWHMQPRQLICSRYPYKNVLLCTLWPLHRWHTGHLWVRDKKSLCRLEDPIETKLTTANILDIMLNLGSSIYRLFCKSNKGLSYITTVSPNPPIVFKNLLKGVSKRISSFPSCYTLRATTTDLVT